MLDLAYHKVLDRISASARGTGNHPRLIAVSKTFPIEAVRRLYELGHRDFGENYAQELEEKASRARALGLEGIRWHFIGPIQSNKAKSIVSNARVIHSIAREKELAAIDSCVQALGAPPVEVFVQVNIDAEGSKSGVEVGALEPLLRAASALEGARLVGLMAIPDPTRDTRQAFAKMRAIRDRLFPEGRLSMGMSADFESAIQEGATDVRVGSLIFGERTRKEK